MIRKQIQSSGIHHRLILCMQSAAPVHVRRVKNWDGTKQERLIENEPQPGSTRVEHYAFKSRKKGLILRKVHANTAHRGASLKREPDAEHLSNWFSKNYSIAADTECGDRV